MYRARTRLEALPNKKAPRLLRGAWFSFYRNPFALCCTLSGTTATSLTLSANNDDENKVEDENEVLRNLMVQFLILPSGCCFIY